MRHHPSAAAQAVTQAWDGVPGHSIGLSADAALLGFADIAHDTRVVLIGPDTLELLCALIRLDCASAAAIRLPEGRDGGPGDPARRGVGGLHRCGAGEGPARAGAPG